MSLSKNIERLQYLWLLLNLWVVRVIVKLFTILPWLIPNTRQKKKLAIYLHSPIYSDGYYRRFEYFFESLTNDGISFECFGLFDEKHTKEHLYSTRKKQYKLFRKIAWRRLKQILKAKQFETVIIQRNLFPLYPDYSTPFFERLLRKLSKDIVLDIWDPIHIWSPELTYETFKVVDKLSVNTPELKDEYSAKFDSDRIFIWPISVKPELYSSKDDFKLHSPIQLFYTGNPGNVNSYLLPIIPILEEVNKKHPLKLIIVGSASVESDSITVEHYPWDNAIFKELIGNADIGLYPHFNASKNYTVAGKVLDYMTTGLPLIGATFGLPKGIIHSNAIFPADKIKDWKKMLVNAINDIKAREQQAKYARDYVTEELSIPKGYLALKRIIEC